MPENAQATLVQLDLFPSLLVITGKLQGNRYPIIGDRVVVGRKGVDLIIADPEISSTHCEIAKSSGGYFVRDLGSTNGTFVNDVQVREQRLKTGDRLGLGRTVMLFEQERVPTTPEAPVPREPDTAPVKKVSMGLYDQNADIAALGALVEEDHPGIEDDDGTSLMDFDSAGVTCRLPSRAVVQLEVMGGPEKGRVIVLTKGCVTIGRHGTDIEIKDQDISRRHLCVLVFGRDQIFMRDLGSTNGCYVNSIKSRFSKLQSGDTLVVGRTVLQLAVQDLG